MYLISGVGFVRCCTLGFWRFFLQCVIRGHGCGVVVVVVDVVVVVEGSVIFSVLNFSGNGLYSSSDSEHGGGVGQPFGYDTG